MTTLDEAWTWYQAIANGMKRLAHLSKYWGLRPERGENPWIDQLALDNVLRDVEADQMASEAKLVEDELADLAVLVLFSVFEATVRDIVEDQVRPEVDGLRHATLVEAGSKVLLAIEEGSFFRILEPFKLSATPDLVEQVNQIRRYRNWVAHGRRPDKKPPALVKPRQAYERLKQFLTAIDSSAASLEPQEGGE
jgi:hypothetical protein